jgi:hypothetical protein
MILEIMWLILIGVIVLVVLLLVMREVGTPREYGLQREVDLRLTYKRYMQIYPSANISYSEYKRMQTQKAYKKAVSSTKIKRMVR